MKKHNITLSIALATIFSSSVAFAEAEVTGKIVHESAAFTDSGTTIGAASSHDGTDIFKSETAARIYIDGEADALSEGTTFHVELQAFTDTRAHGSSKTHESYTQRDPIREAYLDTQQGDWSIRAGKQQVVWGTADGMKLLDAINPTDYSEMAQNQMEDSRIPVWMINAETTLPTGGDMQMIISEGKSSHFAGMGNSSTAAIGATPQYTSRDTGAEAFTEHANGDRGHAFIMKGSDTITGFANGFLNVAPALGAVAQKFDQGAVTELNNGEVLDGVAGAYVSLGGYTMASVNDFAIGLNVAGGGYSSKNQAKTFASFCAPGASSGAATVTGVQCLSTVANTNQAPSGHEGAGRNEQNLIAATISAAEWEASKANGTSMFSYMHDTTFATFDAFVNMKSKYVVDHNDDPTFGWRLKDSTKDGMNWSFNVTHGNDTNPFVNMEWQNNAGALLTETVTTATAVSRRQVASATYETTYYTNQLRVAGGTGNDVGGKAFLNGAATGATSFAMATTDVATLVMTEKLNPITQIGGSFDMAVETVAFGPVVIRGEALYQKDVMSPVVTRESTDGKDLAHGFLVSSVQMVPGDRFKYVLGADITAMTNMMISAQFIQDMNLDYVDSGSYGSSNADDATLSGVDWKYTADMATMSLTNNLNKAEENKEFYSLFLSKPFGASGEHRWNNIYMFEENDGNWNRFDVEFSVNDDTQATVEWNKYWGDENTQFGQLKNSSNIQAGFKYSF
jgi:hypothetical protein